MIEKDKFNNFLNIFQFENAMKDEKAEYFSITGNKLWRRDSARLAAYELDGQTQGNFNYPLAAFALKDEEEIERLSVDAEGALSVQTSAGERKVAPREYKMTANSLKTLDEKNFDAEFELDAKHLVKTLLVFQRKLINQKIPLEKAALALETKNLAVYLQPFPEEKRDLLILSEKSAADKVCYYNFLLLSDLLMNSALISPKIMLSVREPYFTLIKYNDKVNAVINHKRKTGGSV